MTSDHPDYWREEKTKKHPKWSKTSTLKNTTLVYSKYTSPHSRTDSVKRFLTHTPSLSDWCAGSKLATNIVKVSLRKGWPEWKVQVDRCVSTFIMITLTTSSLYILCFLSVERGKAGTGAATGPGWAHTWGDFAIFLQKKLKFLRWFSHKPLSEIFKEYMGV